MLPTATSACRYCSDSTLQKGKAERTGKERETKIIVERLREGESGKVVGKGGRGREESQGNLRKRIERERRERGGEGERGCRQGIPARKGDVPPFPKNVMGGIKPRRGQLTRMGEEGGGWGGSERSFWRLKME